MEIIPLKTSLIHPNTDLLKVLISALKRHIPENCLIAISSKVIALTQGRTATQKDFSSILKREADQILSTGKYALTLKNNIFIANAGIDQSNSQKGQIILWPENLQKTLDVLRQKLQKYFQIKNLGILAVDSCCHPLRKGVNGVCLAFSGFQGIIDERGRKDLFGRKLKVTQRNAADMIAAAAVLVMGESAESTPFALIKNPPIRFTNKKINSTSLMTIPSKKCLFSPLYKHVKI